jgi:hypothetical protein
VSNFRGIEQYSGRKIMKLPIISEEFLPDVCDSKISSTSSQTPKINKKIKLFWLDKNVSTNLDDK